MSPWAFPQHKAGAGNYFHLELTMSSSCFLLSQPDSARYQMHSLHLMLPCFCSLTRQTETIQDMFYKVLLQWGERICNFMELVN